MKFINMIVMIFMVSGVSSCSTLSGGEPGDFGAALLLSPVFIIGTVGEKLLFDPIEHLELNTLDKHLAKIKIGMTKRKVAKIMLGVSRKVTIYDNHFVFGENVEVWGFGISSGMGREPRKVLREVWFKDGYVIDANSK